MKEKLKKISDYEYKLEKSGSMKVPAIIYASEKLMEAVEDSAIQQLANVASLNGILKHALAMPDIHSGYGFPIGGVAAFDIEEGIISPGGVGLN